MPETPEIRLLPPAPDRGANRRGGSGQQAAPELRIVPGGRPAPPFGCSGEPADVGAPAAPPLGPAVAPEVGPEAAKVVPFRQRGGRGPVAVAAPPVAAERPAPPRPDASRVTALTAALLASMAAHAALYVLISRPPLPLASIGLEAMSVELVLGADTPAGLAAVPSPHEAEAVAGAPSPRESPSGPPAPERPTETQPTETSPGERSPPGQPPEPAAETPPPPAATPPAATAEAPRPPAPPDDAEPLPAT
ncbi:hypothetical protein GJ689_11560, partial [Rhodoplanes serenus]|nr:hypothetical protein [Rhodoplanes serenus]